MSHSQDPFVVEDDNSGLEQPPVVKLAKRRKKAMQRPRAPPSTVNEGDRRNRVDPLNSNARRTSSDVDNRSIVCFKIKFELTIPSEIAHHLSRRETRGFIESSLTRSILSGWNTQVSETATRFTKSNVEMTSNSMSIGTNTEPFPLSDEKGVQTSNSAIDASNLSSRTDEGILPVEDFPSRMTERAQAHVSQPQPLPDVAGLQQQRYFLSFPPSFPSPSSSSLSSFSSCPSLLQTYVPGASSSASSSDICRDPDMLFTPPSSDQQKAVTSVFPSSNASFHMTEPNALTLPLAHQVSRKKRQKQMQKDARNLPPLSSAQLDDNNMINIVVQLFDDPDSLANSTLIWYVKRESGNILHTQLWNDGYTYWQEGGSWVFIGEHRVLPWEILEPFTAENGREAQPLRIYRRPFTRIDFLLGKGLSLFMTLIAVILMLWQPWRTDIFGSLRGFFGNFLPMLAQWWWRIDKRPGERTIDPFLNTVYWLNPHIFM
ncbi:hypothetical protein E4T56_gene1725 [Termitomyces sp. T112]|nr:hypothetical protein E4T56_gene1725 [Termitomyces sp. T112]